MRPICLALLLSTAPAALFADTIEARSKVTAVTIFPWGAQVTREVKIDAPEGKHDLIIPDLPANTQANSLRLAGDVTFELVDIVNELGFTLSNRSAAYPTPDRNTHAGRFALEGPEYQSIPLQQVETHPVDVGQLQCQQGGEIGQIGNEIRLPFQQRLCLLVESAIKCLFFNHD